MHRKLIDAVHNNMKELGVSEVINVSWPDIALCASYFIELSYFVLKLLFLFVIPNLPLHPATATF